MSIIGVYDSGIGGLTTAAQILTQFSGNEIRYLADNLNHPLGNRTREQIISCVMPAIAYLKRSCDVVVVACNTASSAIPDDIDVVKLLPPTDFDDGIPTLLMATEGTLAALRNMGALSENNIAIAHTPKLATLIEQCADGMDFDKTLPYLKRQLTTFRGVKRVVLGCSHYLYCKRQLRDILGDVDFADGNDIVLQKLGERISPSAQNTNKIGFMFTGEAQCKKYRSLIKKLINENI